MLRVSAHLWLSGNEGIGKMETTMQGFGVEGMEKKMDTALNSVLL